MPAFVLNQFPQGREGVLVSQRIVPAQAQTLGYRFRYPHLEDALRNLLGRA